MSSAPNRKAKMGSPKKPKVAGTGTKQPHNKQVRCNTASGGKMKKC